MEFDINTLRGLITGALLVAFIGMVFWAYSGKRKKDFTEAASLALEDNQPTRTDNKS